MSEVRRKDAIAGDIVHEYDGIEEADNELPMWWIAIFVGSIVFGAAYWLIYESYHAAPSAREELAVAEAEQRKKAGVVGDEDLMLASKNQAAVSAGKSVFTTNCVACHGDKAEGKIGPNLTDGFWLHGGAPASIFATIKDGVPAKGMPTWGPVLGAGTVKNVAAYILTLRNTNVAGKEPQGERWSGP
ncbi:MAG TPA: cbb3-type cytochrome c oxidase N-terminal domain-containing protein [Polyangiales bacterium]